MTALTCPYCNTAFDAPGGERVVCPRCGEAMPAKLLPPGSGPRESDGDRPAPVESKPGVRAVTIFAALLLTGALIGLGFWYFGPNQKNLTEATNASVPPATRPPLALPGLRYLPASAQVALALQPSPLLQYAERAGKTPEQLLADWGLPVGVFDGLKKAGVPLDRIDHFVLSAGFPDVGLPRLSIVLALREPIRDESEFRRVLNVRQNADKPGRAKVELPGIPLPMEMHKVDDKIYLFSSDGATLEGMVQPKPNAEFLPAGLRDSLVALDPASFAWVATDNRDWANLDMLKTIATLIRQPDLPKRLKGIRALAIGLTLRPDLAAQANIRFPEAKAAGEFEAKAKTKLAETKIDMALEKDWVALGLPGVSFANGVPAILNLFDK